MEGIVLATGTAEDEQRLKAVATVLDAEPVLDGTQLKLALWMHERFFCTVYTPCVPCSPPGSGTPWNPSIPWPRAWTAPPPRRGGRLRKGGRCAGRGLCQRRTGTARRLTPLSVRQAPRGAGRPGEKGVLVSDAREMRRIGTRPSLRGLAVEAEEAMSLPPGRSAGRPSRGRVGAARRRGSGPVREISYFTGCSAATVNKLARDGISVWNPGRSTAAPSTRRRS